jgi:hypothetical protein
LDKVSDGADYQIYLERQAIMYILEGVIYIVCLITEICGVILLFRALKYRTQKCPRLPVFNPKRYFHWKEWFTKKGHRYNWIGGGMIVLGAALCWLTHYVFFSDSL